MQFLLIATVSAGFFGDVSFWSRLALDESDCGSQVAAVESSEFIDARCPPIVDEMAHTIPFNLSSKLLYGLKQPNYWPADYAAGSLSYRLRWSGKTLLTYEEPCLANEKCYFHIDVSETQEWRTAFNLSLVLGARLNKETKCKTSPDKIHTVAFLGPTIAAIYVNQIMYEISWRSKSTYSILSLFFCGELKKVMLPPFYDNNPVGVLYLNQRSLNQAKS
ncbi:hypothetical protein DSO57_1026378 [Entomophthora muscae]|uniref:Uncharacterized protein n=1 Tax=Entomophthora muscae TaxID=34485 RepID=A0ACC2U0H8_9FUNG|nr:hypothetical protein DSO57_1026378 [Entomophthora muscae]